MICCIMNIVIMYCDKVFNLLYIINDEKINEYLDILGRNCVFYVKKSAIQKHIFKKYILSCWAEHLYCLAQLLRT